MYRINRVRRNTTTRLAFLIVVLLSATACGDLPAALGDDPAEAPTDAPSDAPTDAPTAAPSNAPTEAPTDAPSNAPTAAPTDAPAAEVMPITKAQVELVCMDDAARATTAAELGVTEGVISNICQVLLTPAS